MTTSFPLVEGAYLKDLLEQADCLRRTQALELPGSLRDVAKRLRAPQPPFVVLTGMGSSFHALHPLAVRLVASGLRVAMLETSEFVYYWNALLDPNTIVVVVSQSGRSAEVVRLLEMNSGRSMIVGVTNDADSPLAGEADALALIDAGEESSVSCKTYVCTLLALSRIAAALCSGDSTSLAQASLAVADDVEAYMSKWRDHVADAHEFLRQTRSIVLAARGGSLASAGTGGLIIKEAARFPAEGMSAAAFRHGPLEMISKSLSLIVFEGDSKSSALNRGLVSTARELGGNAQLISASSPEPLFRLSSTTDELRPILEILPVQMITLALAAREGREAGAFSYASKITSSE